MAKSGTAFSVHPRHDKKERQVHCPVCKHDKFLSRRSLLNTSWMTFFGFDFANIEADNLICASCGHVQWFVSLKSIKA